jgi:TP901 family phage tail tape measure protein
MASIGTIKVRVGADIRGLQNGLFKAQRRLKAFGQSTGELAAGINRSITLPFALAGAAGVKLASDLGANFSKIENLVGVTGGALNQFKEGVRGLSTEVGKSQAELSDALFTITSAGLRGAEALEVLESASKASAIGLGDTNEVARALTGVMQSYGTEAYSAAEATDVLTAIVREGNLEASSLAPVLGRVTGLAATMGISFEEVGASIATFTRLGVGAEEAVTALRGTMTTFLKPSAEAVQEMARLGLSVTDVQDSIRNNGLAKTLIDLMKRYEGNEQALGKLIPNVRALAGVLGTAGRQGESYEEILKNIGSATGIVDEGFENVSETSAKKFDKALVSLQNAGIELGATLLPLAVDLAEAVRGLGIWFSELDATTKTNIVRFGALAAAVGGSLKVMSIASNTAAMASSAFYTLTKSVTDLGRATKTADKIIAATKIGLLVAGVTAAYFAYQKLTATINSAAKEQARIEGITRGASVAIQEETLGVQALFDTLKSGESTQEERSRAYDKLNSRYASIIGNINAETTDLRKLEMAQDAVTEAIIKRIAAEKKNEAVSEYLGQVAELQVRYQELSKGAKSTTDEQLRFFELMKSEASLSTMALDRTGVVMAGIQKEIENLKTSAKDVGSVFDEAFGVEEPNIPSGGDRSARFKEQYQKEQELIDQELATKKAAEKERQKLREKQAEDVKKLYATIASELRKADEMFIVHGNVQDKTSDKTGAYLSAIEALIDNGFTAGSKAVQELILKMNMVQAEFDAFSSDRLIGEVEKIGDVKIQPIKIDIQPASIDGIENPVAEGYEVDIAFNQEPITAFGQAMQDLFNQIEEAGLDIGEELGSSIIKAVDLGAQAATAFSNLQSALLEKKNAELDEGYEREKERIEKTVGNEESKQSALANLDSKYQSKKQAIQKKSAQQQKVASIAESIINTAVAVTKALEAGPIVGPILAGVVGAMGAAQTAVISSTPTGFATGGKVKLQEGKVTGITNATPRADGDHILAYLKAGEAVLNTQQIAAIGGPQVLAAANVPGFSGGGSTGGSNPTMILPLEKLRASKDFHVTWDEPRIDGDALVFAIEEFTITRNRQRGY